LKKLERFEVGSIFGVESVYIRQVAGGDYWTNGLILSYNNDIKGEKWSCHFGNAGFVLRNSELSFLE
jgi:hypothetical protein